MFRNTNRRCYNGYHVPLETMAHASWPPTYIECDCGNLAKHIVRYRRLPCGAPHFIQTWIWECPVCGQKYRLPKGSFMFESIKQKEDIPNDRDRK
ncbi:hypothetical protein NG885_15075 [Enterococcus faecium]|uniref:hypothetical protein n=1 Tax=Enterococcus TaxID=1350 RepID=UPI00209156F2|nr:hypothetical protein [Enterococcus faecium]MCO5532970.1 hypothetical protein [Enterococcus faecium]